MKLNWLNIYFIICSADCATSQLGGVLGRVSNGISGVSYTLNGVVYNVSGSSDAWDKVFLAVC